MLTVKGADAAIDFYKRAFGAEEIGRVEVEGRIIIAEVRIAEAKFYLSDESPESGTKSPQRVGGTTVRLEFTVPDPDAIAKQAVACGAKMIFPIADQDYGYRQGRLEDPFGHQWVIGRPL